MGMRKTGKQAIGGMKGLVPFVGTCYSESPNGGVIWKAFRWYRSGIPINLWERVGLVVINPLLGFHESSQVLK